ncbi:hypothetical protein J2X77_003488 [Sphingobacterium sp. 2149]|nr:hypothetical protein [Sphingobacterium sp. 2149]
MLVSYIEVRYCLQHVYNLNLFAYYKLTEGLSVNLYLSYVE